MCILIYLPCIVCYSAYDTTVPAEGKALVKTDVAVSLPEGCYGRVGMCPIMLLTVPPDCLCSEY